MDEKNITYKINQELEELEETLSFCDLQLDESQELDDQPLSSHPSSPFEFPFIPNTHLNNNKNDIVFCGKLINKEQSFDDGDDGQSGYLFPLSSARLLNNNKKDLGSISFANPKPISSSSSIKNFRSQSCSSSNSSSRRHKVLIGLAKVPQKMELSDIKKRQSRRTPSPMFPPTTKSADTEVVSSGNGCRGGGGGGGGGGSGRRGFHWGLLRPLRCKSHFVSALAKASLGCIPHV